jgi:general secretion pathway protein F
VTQLLGIGEESGNLGGMLSEAAENMEGALKLKIRRMLALFEPVVIIFLAIVVLTVVISIFLAILEMNEI